MADLCTLEQVNDALRLDLEGTAPDFAADARTADIKLKIGQASDIVLDYVNREPVDPEPPWDATTAPGRVNAATIMLVGFLLDDSEQSLAYISGLSGSPSVDLNNPLVALLYRLRDPVMA